MRRRGSVPLAVVVLVAAAIALAGGSGTFAAFSATTATGPASVSSAADWTAPSVNASVIAASSAGAGVRAGGTYNVYANVADSGNPASGVATVQAGVGAITSGQTAVPLTACSSSCTVGGVTYGYKSAQLTAGAGLAAGSAGYTVTAADSAGNSSSASSFSVTVDNTAPTVSASVAAHATVGSARIGANGTYYVYANASDAGGTGLGTLTANVGSITTGQTAATLSPCSSSCTVGGTIYGYKSAQLTAKSGLAAGSVGYSVTATDFPGNSSGAVSFTATVDNTALPPATSRPPTSGQARQASPRRETRSRSPSASR